MDRVELSAFLRSRRTRTRPDDVGLVPGGRRQTPGLRREEVALLAGISVDYYVRLEQGRGPRPSGQVLHALADALRVSPDERAYLLGITQPPVVQARDVPANVLRFMDRLVDVPAMVISPCYDALAWNPLLGALIRNISTPANTPRWLLSPENLPPADKQELHRRV